MEDRSNYEPDTCTPRGVAHQPIGEMDTAEAEVVALIWRDIRDEWRQNNRAVMDGLIL